MTKNPLINAGAAVLYVVGVATFFYFGPRTIGPVDTVFAPIAMLSLLVLSAAVMALLFAYQPLALVMEGKHAEALRFFLMTIGLFAIFTLVAFLALFAAAR